MRLENPAIKSDVASARQRLFCERKNALAILEIDMPQQGFGARDRSGIVQLQHAGGFLRKPELPCIRVKRKTADVRQVLRFLERGFVL